MFKKIGLVVALLGAFACAQAEEAWVWGKAYWDGVPQIELDLTTTNAAGKATLTASLLDELLGAKNAAYSLEENGLPNRIEFQGGRGGSTVIDVDTISLGDCQVGTLPANGICFKNAEGKDCILKTDGQKSLFLLEPMEDAMGDASPYAANFEGLTVAGSGETGLGQDDPALVYDGGAIHMVEGYKLTVKDCTFTNLVTRFSGGAVSAVCMQQDVVITNCTFADNISHPFNGNGGAVYVSASLPDLTCTIMDSTFKNNQAENGGAISTWTVVRDDEVPMALNIMGTSTNAFLTSFSGNTAIYEGGAILAEGALAVSNVQFSANSATMSGGAICITAIENNYTAATGAIHHALFDGNKVRATGNSNWAAGGAIAVIPAGNVLKIDAQTVFTNNVATAEALQACGGAIYTAENVTNDFHRVMFVDNYANVDAPDVLSYGGALSASSGRTEIDTCVFDCGTNNTTKSFGNAIDFNVAEAFVINSTFRRGTNEAVSAYNGSLAITNCVLVGNGLDSECGYDVRVDGTTAVSVDYSAYGTLHLDTLATTTIGEYNLTNRQASAVYSAETLYLDDSTLNLVAGLGLVQTNVYDYLNVKYGDKNYGYSMGAYETPMLKMTLVADGSKDFDGKVTFDGPWTWGCYTNTADNGLAPFEWPSNDFGTLDAAYTITNWTYAASTPGFYASTNASASISASVTGATERTEWVRQYVDFIYTGTITSNDSAFAVYVYPDEYAWTGAAIKPTHIIVSNMMTKTELSSDLYEYTISNNVDMTASAIVTVKGTNSYFFTESGTFYITGYYTQFYTNGNVLVSVYTNGALSSTTAQVDFAKAPALSDYCLDYQNSTTNKAVYRYGEGGTGADTVTTLKAVYEIDLSEDGVPDKYQKKILCALVNGEWSDSSNAYDRVYYVTMTNGVYTKADGTTEGKWSTDTTAAACTLDDNSLPKTGNYLFSFTSGDWHAANGDTFTSTNLTWGSFPIFYYTPKQSDSPIGPRLRASALLASGDASGASLDITEFAMASKTEIEGAVDAQCTLYGSTISMELANATIEVWGAETLDGEWFKLGTTTTDANGRWAIDRLRTSRTLRATRTTNADRTGTWEISSDGAPKFFKIKHIE